MKKPFFGRFAPLLSGLAVLASLIFVGYELQRNNDLAIVQSQHNLITLNADMKTWLTNPEVLDVLMNEDVEGMSDKDRLLFVALVGGWFDLYEAAYIARERGILTDEQYKVWRNGMCTLPEHWLLNFESVINSDNYIESLVEGVQHCIDSDFNPDF
ncbi:hypothetical protein AB2B38_012325 [Balneola sp. MJW-20]|uniref:hypothetical protein n=1 Tax=Gracilimonas aurantiaca TaxID=3234185 RepID=UPI0034650504